MYSEEEIKRFVEEQGYIFFQTEFKEKERWILVNCGYGHEKYWVRWSNFIKGRRCPKCKIEKLRKDEELKEYVKNRGYELLEIKYINRKKYIKIKCKYGHEWEIRYDSFKRRKQDCYECRGKKKTIKGKEEIENYINKYDYKLLDIFKKEENDGRVSTYITIKCVNNHEWTTRFCSFRQGVRCPYCNISKGEQKIIEWLIKNDIEFIYDNEYFKDLRGVNNGILRPDFIIESDKIWIEYDGEFHFNKYYDEQNFEELQKHDELKNEYAKENGWKLIRIPYWDFDNIEEILKKEIGNNGFR